MKTLGILLIAFASVVMLGCQKRDDLVTTKHKQATLKQSILNTTSLTTILAPQNITSTTNRFFVEGQTTPMDAAFIMVRWQDDASHPGNAISISPSYNPSAYTGFTPPAPLSSWQKGEFTDSVNGSPIFQLNGTHGGILMNSWFTTFQPIVGGGQNTTYEYNFSAANQTAPWSTSISKLWVQADLQLPWFLSWNTNGNSNSPVGQLSYMVYLKDVVNNKAVCIIINAYDNRGTTPIEEVNTDTFTYFASTRFGGTKYSTSNAFSNSWRNTTWNTFNFYRTEITNQNLINIVTDINLKYSQSFSTNPADYLLTSVGILQETFRENGDQVSMGSSFRNFSVHISQ